MTNESKFYDAVTWMQGIVHANARNKGFWNSDTGSVTDNLARIALIASEVGEAVEAVRRPGRCDKAGLSHMTLLEEELADIVIRIMDFAAARGINLAAAILEKHHYNTGRPFMHGKEA